MGDRTDIDALLISALYGELAPADEARLAAHLESHPADRTALSDLTRTRTAVRESRILAVQLEPPQSVSALLLREAARRAPARAPSEGWFARFTRSFMAHPAMAAAAMLVLVVGVAGTLYVRGVDQFAEPTSNAASEPHASAAPAAPARPARAPSTGHAELAVGGGGAVADKAGEPARAADQQVAAKPQAGSGYAVDLDGDLRYRQGAWEADSKVGALAKDVAAADGKPSDPAMAPMKPPASPPAAPKIAAAPAPRGIGVNVVQPSLEPKDLPEEAGRAPAAKEAPAKKLAAKGGSKASDSLSDDFVTSETVRADSAPGGAAPPASPGPQPASQPAPVVSKLEAAPEQAKAKTARTVARGAPAGVAQEPAPPPPPPAATAPRDARFAGKADAAKNAEEKADDQGVLEWAQRQREQAIAYVKASNCRAAASAAIAIYNRAPDYYAANVATDRELKPCIQYVAAERERAERSRAAKRAISTDTPAAAPPPVRK